MIFVAGGTGELGGRAVRLLREQGHPVRCLTRPDAFQDIHLAPMGRFDVARGKVAVFGKGDTKRRWVSTDDVAALVAALAVEPDPPAMVEFGGPEALTRNEAIAVAEQATGRRHRVGHEPRAGQRPTTVPSRRKGWKSSHGAERSLVMIASGEYWTM